MTCTKIKNKIGLYRESKTDTIFDAFYHSDLDMMEELLDQRLKELEPYVTISKEDDNNGRS